MRQLMGFVRTTLIGGLLFLVPIVVLAAILGKAIGMASQASPPLVEILEALNMARILSPEVVALLLLVLFCFAAGLFSRTAFARKLSRSLESKILSNLPGYSFIKSLSEGIAGVDTSGARDPVIVRIEDAWQIAFVMDRLDDGHIAVYIPGVPEPRSGSLYFVTADRVKPLNVQLKPVMQTLRRMGIDSNDLLRGHIAAETSAK